MWLQSILTFVDSMPELVDKLSAAELSTYVASTRAGLLQKPISIEDAQKGLGTSLFTQISENCTRTFDDNLALAAALVDITLADVRALAEATVDLYKVHTAGSLYRSTAASSRQCPQSPPSPLTTRRSNARLTSERPSMLGVPSRGDTTWRAQCYKLSTTRFDGMCSCTGRTVYTVHPPLIDTALNDGPDATRRGVFLTYFYTYRLRDTEQTIAGIGEKMCVSPETPRRRSARRSFVRLLA